jgi:acyl carrier protein
MIEFLGRLDQQVKIRGYRIELDEIQAILQQQPALKECVVIAREDSAGDQQLVAYVVLRQGMSASSSEMRSYLQGRLPGYMIPSSFISLEALPLMLNGKLDRQALAALAQNRLAADSTFVSPQTAVEKQLAALWCELLGLERVGIHDDFFDSGGHSLLAIRLRFRIQTTFGVDIPLSHFFETTTIHKLATTIEQMQENRSQFSTQTSIQPADRRSRRRKVPGRVQRKAE